MAKATDKKYDHLFQLLLCGDSSVGKTCLISRFADNQFRHTHINTIGIDFKLKTLTVGDKRIRLQIWDTAGQERFETLTAQYYRRAQGIVLVYDITREDTFRNVVKWMRNIEDHGIEGVKVILVGNKVDLEDSRQVSTRRGQKLAGQHNIQLFETSAWKDTNVSEAFTALTRQVLEQSEGGKEKSTKVKHKAPAARNDSIRLQDSSADSDRRKSGGGCCSSSS